MESKKCTKCEEVKGLGFFYKNKGTKDGYETMCKSCRKQYSKENKERRSEYAKQYYEENKERIKQYRQENKERLSERKKEYQQENKEGIAEYQKQYRQENKERIDERKKQYYQENKECIVERTKQYNQENKERKAEYNKQYQQENKKRIAERKKEYQQENKERIKQYRKENKERRNERMKQWREENKERLKQYSEEYNERKKERKITDPLYKLSCNLRSRTASAFRYQSYRKTSKTAEMLGVPYEIAFAHIERQFTKGMTWENHGEWHIDHIIPLASAQTESELIKLCHYTNLQPLWAKDNQSKHANVIDGTQVKLRL